MRLAADVGIREGDREGDCDGRRLGVSLLADVEMEEGRIDGDLVVCRRDGTAVIVGGILGRRVVGMIDGRGDLEGLCVEIDEGEVKLVDGKEEDGEELGKEDDGSLLGE